MPMLLAKSQRLHKGLTQHQLGTRANIATVRICYIEKGVWIPSPAELEAIAQVLGVHPPSRLLEPAPDPVPAEAVQS